MAFGWDPGQARVKMRCVSVANDHLGPKPLISDSAIRRSLWPLQCQPVALDDNEWHVSKTLIQSSIQTHGQVSKKSYFDSKYDSLFNSPDIWHFWKSYCWLRLIWGLDHRSRSRSRRTVLPGAGAGAGVGMLPRSRSRSRSRSRPIMLRLRIPALTFSTGCPEMTLTLATKHRYSYLQVSYYKCQWHYPCRLIGFVCAEHRYFARQAHLSRKVKTY